MDKIVAHYPSQQAPITRTLGVLLALLLTVATVLQLFGFEKMPEVVAHFWPDITGEMGLLVATLAVTAQVFALPFLLGMRLTLAMRLLSITCAIGAVAYWSVVAMAGAAMEAGLVNTGLAGPGVAIPNGPWLLVMMLGVATMLAWYLWHSYTHARRTHHHLRNAHR